MEQLEAFRQKKAKERLARVERIQKRLEQIRGQSVVRSQSAAGAGTVQKSASRVPAERLLKDSTNRVSGSSVTKRELSARAKLVAGKMRTDGNKTSAERRLTVTLSSAAEASEVGQKHSSGEDENVPEQLNDDDDDNDDVFAKTDCQLPDGQKHKPSHGKR